MALEIYDRVKETTTTTGTGTYTLAGAVTGFETFTANLDDADTTYYACTDNTNFEVGIGTFTSSGTTLARTTILARSNSNSAVNWSSGTRTIFMTYPAGKAVFKDASDNINGTFVGNITGNVTGNTSGTAATVTTAAQSNITSLGTLTTLTVDNIIINGTTIGHATDDTDLITLADGIVTVAGEISVTTLDIGGTNVTSTAAELNILDGVTSTAAELNLLDGVSGLVQADLTKLAAVDATADELDLLDGSAKSTASITLADADGFIVIDGTTTKQIPASDIKTYISAGDITGVTAGVGLSGGGSSGGVTLTLDLSELSDVTPANGDKLATLDSDGSAEQLTTVASLATLFAGTGLTASSSVIGVDAAQTGITSLLATDIKIGEDDQTKIDFETADTINFYAGNEKQLILTNGALTPGADNILDLGSSGVEFKDGYFDGTVTADAFAGPLTGNVTGNASGTAATVTGAAQTAITSLGTLTTLSVDNITINGNDISSTAGTDLTITPLSGQQIVLDGTIVVDAGVVTGATSITSTAFVGDITGDVTGNADTATALATARTIGGTSFDGTGNISVALATLATTVTITDNEDTDEDNAIIFTAGGDVDGGDLGLESDGTLTYNPSTGKVTATGFIGALTGAVTGNVAGNLTGTVSTATQNSITTATGLVTTGALNSGSITSGFGTIDTGSSAITTTGLISGGSLDIDDVLINGTTIGHTDDTDLITLADGVVTVAGELDAVSGDFSGDVDVDGTLEADAITVNGSTLASVIADEATALAIALG